MTFDEFQRSLAGKEPPGKLGGALCALWWDGRGDWERAHECTRAENDTAGAWVHAYLHRKEGDAANARYWYNRAGKAPATTALPAEWEAIVRALLTDE